MSLVLQSLQHESNVLAASLLQSTFDHHVDMQSKHITMALSSETSSLIHVFMVSAYRPLMSHDKVLRKCGA